MRRGAAFPGPLAAGLLLLFGLAVLREAPPGHRPAAQWPFVAALVALPLWWSRSDRSPPRWSLVALGLAASGLLLTQTSTAAAVVLILIGTAIAVMRLPDGPALAAAAASLALALLAGLRQRLEVGTTQGLVSALVSYSVAYGALAASRQRRRHLREMEGMLARLEAEHRQLEAAHARLAAEAEGAARLAAAEERNRIAREIHDVLAHALTVIIVQAEAAAVRLRADPAAAEAQVGALATLAREALQEARLAVAALRADPGTAGLDAVRRLCRDARRLGGLRCDLAVEGTQRPLPAPVALAAYRILQEALTNAHRHGHAQGVTVTVAFLPDGLRLTIVDDGGGPPAADVVPGSGLRGMAERAADLGGWCTAGALPSGFAVRVWLPLVAAGTPGRRGGSP